MEVAVSTWGNSLGVRLPKIIGKTLGLKNGAKMSMSLEDGKLILFPLKPLSTLRHLSRSINLEEMVKRVTPQNKPNRQDFEDAPMGREVW